MAWAAACGTTVAPGGGSDEVLVPAEDGGVRTKTTANPTPTDASLFLGGAMATRPGMLVMFWGPKTKHVSVCPAGR